MIPKSISILKLAYFSFLLLITFIKHLSPRLFLSGLRVSKKKIPTKIHLKITSTNAFSNYEERKWEKNQKTN